MINLNFECENLYTNWNIDKDKTLESAKKIFNYYINTPEIFDNSCLKNQEFDTISFDFLFCDKEKTHEINRDYRQKDYPADIITFAIFADSPENEKFILNLEINLGEIIIALDKVIEESEKKGISKEEELIFLISHGILHLLGFDHQTEEEFEFVVTNQKKALNSIGIVYDKI